MKTYKIELVGTFTNVINVKAKNEQEALEMAQNFAVSDMTLKPVNYDVEGITVQEGE